MNFKFNNRMLGLYFLFVLPLMALNIVFAAEVRDMGGWEKNGKYNRYYDLSDSDSFKGKVIRIKEVVPLPGMSPGVALEVRESKSEVVLVHLCPVWFANIRSIGIKKGDRVKVNGVWAEINGKEVFMASKVKKEGFEFKVRLTKDGTPFWTMTPEELRRERSSTNKTSGQ